MKPSLIFSSLARVCLALAFLSPLNVAAQGALGPIPPEQTIRLIFIHHSTGENWLRDDHGGLGQALAENDYFVSDTNYGWGPDAIGDRTDIINWPEWFRGPDSERYLQALYQENEQHAEYTRLPDDPGGENEIILFKSCFPNSALEGNPGDPPLMGDGLTVSNAKFIYNDLLQYFATRPDKLFVVITAPPLQDPTYADNARAFNNWLVEDWLAENNYTLPNVAVFDFYNVLTHPDNHHWNQDGQVEHVVAGAQNTLYYPSAPDDDHPNAEGSRKATAEFVPLLNLFYQNWKANAPLQPPALPGGPVTLEGNRIDDFEAGAPVGSEGWQAYWDEATETQINCGPEAGKAHSGSAALRIEYAVQANSWSTCALMYTAVTGWDTGDGVTFFVHADQAGKPYDVLVYGGTPEEPETYVSWQETTQAMAEGWAPLSLTWDELRRAEWESDSNAPVDPAQVTGIAFGFDGWEDATNTGWMWVDDLQLLSGPGEQAAEPPVAPTEAPPPADQEQATPVSGLPETQPPVQETQPGAPVAEAPQPEQPTHQLPCLAPMLLGLLAACAPLFLKKGKG